MNSAIDAWTRASRSYADGQPLVAEQALRSALESLPESKGVSVASNQSIPLVRCALRAAIESCGLTGLLAGAPVASSPSPSVVLADAEVTNSEGSALVQLSSTLNQAIAELVAGRVDEGAEWIDLGLKKFFFFQLQWAADRGASQQSSAKRARHPAQDATLALCLAAVQAIADANSNRDAVSRMCSLIVALLQLRTVVWLMKGDAKLASKLLSALRTLPSASLRAPEVRARRVVAHVPLVLLAVSKFMRGKYERTLALLDAMKKDVPTSTAFAPALYLEGLALMRVSRLEAAAETFELCALLESALTAGAHLMQGVCLAKLDKHFAAIQHFQNSLSCEIESRTAVLNIALEYASLGMHEQKLKMFEYLAKSVAQRKVAKTHRSVITLGASDLSADVSTGQVEYHLAKSAYDVGNYAAAAERYASLLRSLSTSSAAGVSVVAVMRDYAYCLLQTRRFDACAALCRLAVLSVPWDVPLLLYLADALRALGQLEAALDSLNRALRVLDEADEAARRHKQQSGDTPLLTLSVMRTPVPKSPATALLFAQSARLQLRARTLNNRALILSALDRETEACSSLNAAVTLVPEWIEPAYNRSLLFLKCKEEKAAAVSWMEWRRIPLDLAKGAYETLHRQFQKDTPNVHVLSDSGTAWEAAAREMDIKIVGWWRRALDDERLQREARDASEFLSLLPEA